MNATLRPALAEYPTLVLVHFVSVINAAEIGCEWRMLFRSVKRKYIPPIKKGSEQKAMD